MRALRGRKLKHRHRIVKKGAVVEQSIKAKEESGRQVGSPPVVNTGVTITVADTESGFLHVGKGRSCRHPTVTAPYFNQRPSYPLILLVFQITPSRTSDRGKFRSGVWTNSHEAAGRDCCCPHGFEVSEHRCGNFNRKL